MACNKAVQAQKAQIAVRDKELGQAEAMLNVNAKEIADLSDKVDAWYRSPYLWVIVGAAVGAYVVKR